MLIRHRAVVRKDKHVGVQRITDADATSGRATNYGCWCNIGPSQKTEPLACNELRMLMHHRATLVTQTIWLYCIMQVHCMCPQTQASVAICFHDINLSIYQSICLSIYPSIYLSTYLFIYPSIYPSTYLSIYLPKWFGNHYGTVGKQIDGHMLAKFQWPHVGKEWACLKKGYLYP
jgi:hypothetical protein